MLLPRPRASGPSADSCDGQNPCDSSLPADSDPTSTDDNDVSYLPRSGTYYGYMGITMLVILAVLCCALWLYFTRQQRARRASLVREAKTPAASPMRSRFGIIIGKRKKQSSSPSPSPPSLPGLPVTNNVNNTEASSLPPSIEPPEETGKQPRWVSQSGVRKGLIKEVSGGMVVYTTPNRGSRPARPEPTAQPLRRERESRRASDHSAWYMEHVHGVRYMARTPSEGTEDSSNCAPDAS